MLSIVKADSLDQLHAVYRLRYDIYVSEMHRKQLYASDETRTIQEPFDDNAINLVASIEGQPVGTVRLNFFSSSEPGIYYRLYQLNRYGRYYPDGLGMVTKLMVKQNFRASAAAYQMLLWVMQRAYLEGVAFGVMDCNRPLVRAMENIGWRRYKKEVEHPEYGAVTPMCFVLSDFDYLDRVKSPFLEYALRHTDTRDNASVSFFYNRLSEIISIERST